MFFVIQDDKPIYEFYFNQGDRQVKELFLVHSALDTVEYALTKKKDYYLGQLKNDELSIFAFINPNQLKLLLVLNLQNKKEIDKKTDSQIRDFFIKANEYLASAMLNPLYKIKEPIKSKVFDERIRNLARDSLKTLLLEKKK